VTIIFVSHDANIVMSLADKAIVMDGGKMIAYKSTKDAIDLYDSILFGKSLEKFNTKDSICAKNKLSKSFKDAGSAIEEFTSDNNSEELYQNRENFNSEHVRLGNRRAELIDYLLISNNLVNPTVFKKGDFVEIYTKYHFKEHVSKTVFGFGLRNIDGTKVCGANTNMLNNQQIAIGRDSYAIWKCSFKLDLLAGDYLLNLGVSDYETGEPNFIDTRRGLIILKLLNNSICDGVADLDLKICPIQM
jgi:lipopolysaccharide transport system ATP-binding protein